ncbi:MAG: tetratricopeptide repeat protein [Planctomycetota bacterium]
MKRIGVLAWCLLVAVWAHGQVEFDTIYKFPDKKGETIKVIRGIVTAESKTEVKYKIAEGQEKTIEAELVSKVVYIARGGDAVAKAQEKVAKGLAEFDKGGFEEATTILGAAIKDAEANPRLPEWIGAYARFHTGLAFLRLGQEMESKGIAQVLVKRRYESAVKSFDDFAAKHPTHRLQFDLPVAQATALLKLGAEQYDKALALLDGVPSGARNPYAQLRRFNALKLKGDILVLKGRNDQALDAYKELMRAMPAENPIDEVVGIRQDVGVFIGMVLLKKAEDSSDATSYKDAEEYFGKILADVAATGVTVRSLGKVYLSIGECRRAAKDWEKAMWYYLHGCIAFFDDPEVHRESLLNVIICLDELVQKTQDRDKKKQLMDSLAEYYRQLKLGYGATPAAMKGGTIYKKYFPN